MFCSSRIFLSTNWTTATSPESSTARRRRRCCWLIPRVSERMTTAGAGGWESVVRRGMLVMIVEPAGPRVKRRPAVFAPPARPKAHGRAAVGLPGPARRLEVVLLLPLRRAGRVLLLRLLDPLLEVVLPLLPV